MKKIAVVCANGKAGKLIHSTVIATVDGEEDRSPA